MTNETIQKCIDLLNTDGINSKEQVKKILQGELETIKEANPSEALKCLEEMYELSCDGRIPEHSLYEYIKQALLKAQEKEKEELFFKNIHNTKVKTPLVSIFEGLSKDERFKFTEHIYYHWEEMKEALEDKNSELEKENTELKAKAQEQEKATKQFKGSKEVKIEIPESSLMDYNPVKQYLKWEDLEFKEERQEIPVRMGETIYTLVLRKTDGGNKIAKLLSPKRNYMGEWGDMFYEESKQFFNDLHLERVEE